MTDTTEDERNERSRRYPATTVTDAVGYLALIHRGVGMNGGSREALAHAIGHSSLNGASKKKLASLVQYGLIDRDGDRYRISDLARRVLIPVTDREKEEAIAEAVRRPALFQEIGQSFDQQPIPSMLANVLAREHGVLPRASTDVAALFVKSVEQAGLVVDGILNWSDVPRSSAASTTEPSTELRPPSAPAPSHAARTVPMLAEGLYQDYSIPLDSRGRKALIHLPTPVESRDLDRLTGWISYMRSVLNDSGDNVDG